MKDQSDPAAAAGHGALVVPDVLTTPAGLPRRESLRLAPRPAKRRDSKRDALLAAARAEFAANGFLGTHIAVVATRVGIRKSTFFHYFDGKEALYEAAVGDVLVDLVGAVDASVGRVSSFGDRLDALVDCLQHHADVDAALPRLLLRSLVDAPPPGTPRPTSMDQLAERIAAVVQLGVREGRVPACDVALAVASVIGVVCLQQGTSTTSLDLPAADPLIGVTPLMRVAALKLQVRRLLDVR